jgi:pimeloyl-[acyl-carrier protein] methyl ester esterase
MILLMADSLNELMLENGRFSWREIGAGRPLVLLHGWSMSHAVFSELADLLAGDFRLLLPDLPGHGASDPVDPCSLISFSKVLSAWLKSIDLASVDLLGWSLGGQVALQFAADFPSYVRRLLLISTTPRFCSSDDWTAGLPAGELRALRKGLQKRYLATMGEFFDLQFEGETITVERRQEILRFAVRPVGLPEPDLALQTLNLLGQEDLRPLLDSICQSALLMHGENDLIIPHPAGQYLSEQLTHARLVSFPGIGHAPFLSCPERVSGLVREFCL